MSYNEQFFVLRNKTGYYEFYGFDEKYEVTHLIDIFINKIPHKKGMMTNDDKYFFVSLNDPDREANVAKYDINGKKITFVADKDGSTKNQVDFHLFAATQNRFVTLSQRGKQFYLQLRALDTL